MIAAGETSRSGADVLAGVVAASEAAARAAAGAIRVEYEVLEPLTDVLQAEHSAIRVHEKGNLLETCVIRRGGDVDEILAASAHHRLRRVPHPDDRARLPGDRGRGRPARRGRRASLFAGPGSL